MRRLDPADLLRLWEAGVALHPIDRALAVLATAEPGADAARLPLGTRDALLLEARALTLGDRLDATEACPECGERVELALSCRQLVAGAERAPERWTVEHGDLRLTVRPLDSTDAAAAVAVAAEGDARAAAATLLARAVVSAERSGEPVAVEGLPGETVEAVTASAAEHDGGAELVVDLACPACAASWQRVLDVAGFVWAELAARAERLLEDVHRLARTYGWSEAEVLSLGDARRAAYLAMVDR